MTALPPMSQRYRELELTVRAAVEALQNILPALPVHGYRASLILRALAVLKDILAEVRDTLGCWVVSP